MGKKSEEIEKPTYADLKAELDEAIAMLAEAFKTGNDGDVSYISGRVRAIEAELKEYYYSRWGIP